MRQLALVVLVAPLLLQFAAPVAAADLDSVHDPLGDGGGRRHTSWRRNPVLPPQTVLGPDLVPVPGLRVGGAFVYARGLNGPDGPPAYPLLPFAFGYGY